MRWLFVIGMFLGSLASAQSYTGIYTSQGPSGPLTLELNQQGESLTGVLSDSSIRFELDGFVFEDGAGGTVNTAEGLAGFEAYLQGDTLGLYLFELDAEDNPIIESATELIMIRRDPLTTTDPLVGTFSDGNLTLQVQGADRQYSGQFLFSGQTYAFAGQGSGGELRGSFFSGGREFEFTADLQGETLVFVTGGTTYRLPRQVAPVAANPLADTAEDPVVAQGRHAMLTRGNALAFIEALEFALEQVGYAYRFTEPEREQLLEAIIQEFPAASQMNQVVLSQAQDIWSRVQTGWARSPDDEKREFLLGVFILAFGEETVQQWVGPTGGAGRGDALGSARCESFEDCTSQLVDQQTWTDTFNAQGCWAAAGCDSYDSSTGTFSYSDDY